MTPNPFLSREDTNDDDYFYEIPRLVIHIDDNSIERLEKFYRKFLRDDDAVLDPNSFQYNKPGVLSHSWKIHEGNLNFCGIN